MSTPAPGTRTLIHWSLQHITVANFQLTIARLPINLLFRSHGPGAPKLPGLCWLDSGAPLSVVPFYLHRNNRLAWQPISGIRTTWSGQPCDLGFIDVWLPTQQPPFFRGPLSVLAKFPRSDPPGPPIPALLGLNFILAHQAELSLLPPPRHGSLLVP